VPCAIGLRQPAHNADEPLVTTLARRLPCRVNSARPSLTAAPPSALLVVLLALATLALLPASTGAAVKLGLQPRDQSSVLSGLAGGNEENEWFYGATPESFTNAEGNPVPHGTNMYATNPSVLPAPTFTVRVLSRSLASVMRRGIVVRYGVNEQVAGHFEVLLNRKLARKLKIGGASATGMPVGSEPQVVIGKALLITIKGGKSTEHIILSKRTAERLPQVKKLGLGLRLTVRNAATVNPATATLVRAFTLHR
jgi:hypothetical protein